MKRLIFLLILALALSACTGEADPTTIPATTEPTAVPTVTTEPTLPPETTIPPTQEELLLESMSLRQKIGQLFFVAPEGLVPDQAPVRGFSEELAAALEEYPVGGIILFADNLENPEQLKTLNAALSTAGEIPMFLGVDEEGGVVARLANHSNFSLPRYRSAASVGASGNPEDAFDMGKTIGTYLREYGFHVDFAPVADVNTNPRNPIIGTRAFSSDAELAAQLVEAMADGLNDAGITASYKHFPGHGDTAEDSHAGIAVSWKTEEEMLGCEWLPFLSAGENDFVMVGHVAVPELTGDMTPATMSYRMVTEKLTGELGFSGLVITDSMSMGAVTKAWSAGEAAVNALNAGCDILLMPEDLPAAFEAVLDVVEEGIFPEEQLDGIVLRILRFKIEAGLLPKE